MLWFLTILIVYWIICMSISYRPIQQDDTLGSNERMASFVLSGITVPMFLIVYTWCWTADKLFPRKK